MINTTIRQKGFAFLLRHNYWYQLMERSLDRDTPIGKAFRGKDIESLPLSTDKLNSNYYLKRVKCIPGTHEPNIQAIAN